LNQYQRAFDEVKTFCRANAEMTLVSDDVSTLSCADVLRAIADVEDLLEHSGRHHEMSNRSSAGRDKIGKVSSHVSRSSRLPLGLWPVAETRVWFVTEPTQEAEQGEGGRRERRYQGRSRRRQAGDVDGRGGGGE
jgi:hypothetical protein